MEAHFEVTPAGGEPPFLRKYESSQATKKVTFTKFDVILNIWSVIMYYADVFTDCYTAYNHFHDVSTKPLNFIFTVSCIIVANVFIAVLNIWWYCIEFKHCKRTMPATYKCVRIFASLCMLGPIMRYIDSIKLGLASKRKETPTEQRKFIQSALFERLAGARLGLLEAFFEAAPQFLLQVHIQLHKDVFKEEMRNLVVVWIGVAFSMLSLASSLVTYQDILRRSQDKKEDIKLSSLFPMFLWRFFEVIPRILIFAMFLSMYDYWFWLFLALHTIVMIMWNTILQTDFCKMLGHDKAVVLAYTLMWNFCFYNYQDGHSRRRAVMYYLIFYTGNFLLLTLWIIHPNSQTLWFRPILIGVGFGSLVPAVLFMILYYKCAHPTKIPNHLATDEWFPCSKANGRDSEGDAAETKPFKDATDNGPPAVPVGSAKPSDVRPNLDEESNPDMETPC